MYALGGYTPGYHWEIARWPFFPPQSRNNPIVIGLISSYYSSAGTLLKFSQRDSYIERSLFQKINVSWVSFPGKTSSLLFGDWGTKHRGTPEMRAARVRAENVLIFYWARGMVKPRQGWARRKVLGSSVRIWRVALSWGEQRELSEIWNIW